MHRLSHHRSSRDPAAAVVEAVGGCSHGVVEVISGEAVVAGKADLITMKAAREIILSNIIKDKVAEVVEEAGGTTMAAII